MKKITKEELRRLRSTGAVVRKKSVPTKEASPASPPAKKETSPASPARFEAPPAPSAELEALARATVMNSERSSAAMMEIAKDLQSGQRQFAEQLAAAIERNAARPKPIPYRFTIQRNKRGLIESVDAIPIDE